MTGMNSSRVSMSEVLTFLTRPTRPRSMISGRCSPAPGPLDNHLIGLDEAVVLSRKTHGPAPVAVYQGDDLGVDLAAQDHLHHVHGLPVGGPSSRPRSWTPPPIRERTLPILGAAAVDHDGSDPDEF